MMFARIILMFTLTPLSMRYLSAQEHYAITDSANRKWQLSGQIESFLSLSRYADKSARISDFQFNHNRYNTPNINLGFIGLDHASEKTRMQIAFQVGTYMRDNYANEPKMLRHVLKSFAGIRISKQKNIWIDAGIFPSYIGFESTNTFENMTLTRSLMAENSPYFLSGIRVNQLLNNQSEFNVFLLTGWQRIVPQKGNSLPSFGWQWLKKISKENLINWSFFVGTDLPDSLRKIRFFNNLYWTRNTNRWTFTLGLDIGFEQQSKNNSSYLVWWSPVFIGRYEFSNHWSVAIRCERYTDKHRIITRPTNGLHLNAIGYSINLDHFFTKSLLCRIEWRSIQSTQPVFPKTFGDAKKNSCLTISLAHRFSVKPKLPKES